MSGAKSALRGYKYQFIYALHSILQAKNLSYIFHLEGNEDFDIYQNNKLVESIQVKFSDQNLTLADFKPDKRNSFFHRSLESLKQFPNVQINIVSFGNIGPELLNAWQGHGQEKESITNKLVKYGFSDNDIELLFKHINLQEVDKPEIEKNINTFLQNTLVGFDVENTLDLLISWIFEASKNSEKMTYDDVVNKINNIGKYLKAREVHHQEWFSSIVPIDTVSQEYAEKSKLQEEFNHGISARYEHILENVDVIRDDKLTLIDQAFRKASVVVIHGASGQGKTTLAYRYAHDYFAKTWRFQIKLIETRQQGFNISTALMGHVNAVGVPILVYIDIAPRETYWLDIITELARHKNLRLLITIREEDWKRATIETHEVLFEEIELKLDKVEAEKLYQELSRRSENSQFLSFDDAWQQFDAECPPLIEFSYFITQNETLKSRLSSQIKRLQNEVREGRLAKEEFEILRLVSVASAYGSRLDIKKLANFLKLSQPEFAFDLFEKEYLLQITADKYYVDGLHPVRSAILVELLIKPPFNAWESIANQLIPLLAEKDIETFLLYAFSRHYDVANSLLTALSQFQPNTWTGIGGVSRALLWLGLKSYVLENIDLIKEVDAKFSSGSWLLTLKGTIFDTNDIDNVIFNLPHSFTDEQKQEIQDWRKRQTPREKVLIPFKNWIKQPTHSVELPTNQDDWRGFAETGFWIGYLALEIPILSEIQKVEIEQAISQLPLKYLAELVLALSFLWKENFNSWLKNHETLLLNRFKAETQTVFIEDDGKTIRIHYILAIEQENQSIGAENTNNSLHEESVRRVTLLRNLFPTREVYACKGYGHSVEFLKCSSNISDFLVGETSKEIDVKYLPIKWLITVNATFRHLVAYQFRPRDWQEYAQFWFSLRKNIAGEFLKVETGLETHFRHKKITNLFKKQINTTEYDNILKTLRNSCSFPESAVDEWGFTEENSVSGNTQQNVQQPVNIPRRELALEKYKPYISKLNEFHRSVKNLLEQMAQVITVNSVLGRAEDANHKQQILATADEMGFSNSQHLAHVSIHNFTDALKALPIFQQEFRKLFEHLLDVKNLIALEKREDKIYWKTWDIWFDFAYHPERIVPTLKYQPKRRLRSILEQSRKNMIKQFQKLTDEKSVKVEILFEDTLDDKEKQLALWMTFNVENAIQLHEAYADVLSILNNAIDHADSKILQWHAHDIFWHNIMIIPLVQGKSLDRRAYKIPIYRILQSCLTENDFNQVYYEISDEQWIMLKIADWESSTLAIGRQVQQTIGELYAYLIHITDFRRLKTPEDNEIWQQYWSNLNHSLSNIIQKVLDSVVESTNYCNNLSDNQKQSAYFIEIMRVFLEIYPKILPPKILESKGDTEINMEDLENWLNNSKEVMGKLEWFYLCWTDYAIEQETNF